MEKELVVQYSDTEVEIALLENGKLVELHSQQNKEQYTVGDILLGRVRKLVPDMKGAFVDIGHAKDAFLHYTDLGPTIRSLIRFTDGAIEGKQQPASLDSFSIDPEISKTGSIEQVLQKRKQLLVQVQKEPISTKGHRLTCEISIPGRFLVLTPFSNIVAVSKKIESSDERKRLLTLGESIRPKNFGLIIRTAAEGKKTAEMHDEVQQLQERWATIHEQLLGAEAPKKLLSELDKTSSILRDLLSDSFSRITVDNKDLHDSIKNYLQEIAPDQIKILTLLKGKSAFDNCGVTRQIKQAFGKTANLPSGAYLVIEHTEALHVVDVNSGHKMTSSGADTAALNVNLEACYEIARQMRLRDIGGIIIIDFIDMKNPDHKKMLFNSMRDAMEKDRAQHTILPLSKFGLMQITRQRTRPEIKINTAEVCPTCNGTGSISASILITDDIERDYDAILYNQPKAKITLEVNPYLEAWFKRGFPSQQMRWFLKRKKWLNIRSNNNLPITRFAFYDENQDEIRINFTGASNHLPE